MPDMTAHLRMVERNHACLDLLLPHAAAHPEWVTAVAFYEAVHLVEALFAGERPPAHSSDHVDRLSRLQRVRCYSHIYGHFKNLYAASRVARYLENSGREFQSFDEYISVADVEAQVVNHWLNQVRQSVAKLLNITMP